MHRLITVFLLLLNINAIAQQKFTKEDLEELKNRLEGTFDSHEQSQMDKSYFDIVLHMKEFDLKGKRPDGYWLYVEQAMAEKQDEPYRQRVYRVYREKDALVSKVYELNEPLRFTGAWNDVSKLKKLTKDSLIEREGCAIYLNIDNEGNFYGSTPGKECTSSLKGAKYATSEVKIYPNLLISWDRGFDANDQQVWGAEKDGYKLRKFTIARPAKD